MTISCIDCDNTSNSWWLVERNLPVCADCSGDRDKRAMRKADEFKMYVGRNEVRNGSGTFRLPATIYQDHSNGISFINHVQTVFNNSVWVGIQSNDSSDPVVLLRRTKKKYMPNGDVI